MAGEYTVTIDTTDVDIPNGYRPTTVTSASGTVTLPVGGNESVNFGYVPEGSVCGTVWRDPDGQGDIDSTDTDRYCGATVTLRDSAGNVVCTTETDGNGEYCCEDVPPGTGYVVDCDESTGGIPSDYKSKSSQSRPETSLR